MHVLHNDCIELLTQCCDSNMQMKEWPSNKFKPKKHQMKSSRRALRTKQNPARISHDTLMMESINHWMPSRLVIEFTFLARHSWKYDSEFEEDIATVDEISLQALKCAIRVGLDEGGLLMIFGRICERQ
jgi:hypothetical protein